MNKPALVTFEQLRGMAADAARPVVWRSARIAGMAEAAFPGIPGIDKSASPEKDRDFIAVIGGGELIDRAKIWRNTNAPGAVLAAVPTIWGSGAENSPIAILNGADGKEIFNGPEFLPDYRAVWPELSESISDALAAYACGDTWSHALEGFLSPLANEALREELSSLIGKLASTAIGRDAAWFELSSSACAAQARSSVGLVHGIAHTLEASLRASFPEENFGHAALCSIFLLPVMSLNFNSSEKPAALMDRFHVSKDAVFSAARTLFDERKYKLALPLLEQNWMSIIRNPMSRTNCALVRPGAVSHFTGGVFE